MDPETTTENNVQGQETGTGVETPSNNGNENAGQGNEHSLANDFLKNVPATERPILEKYIKDWDAGVTKRFQEIHGQYEPYKQLGDPEQLRQAMEVYQLLDQSPQVVYQVLKEQFGEEVAAAAAQQQQEEQEEPDEWTQRLSPLQESLERQQQMVDAMAQILLQNQQQAQETEEDAALDQYLGSLKAQYGEFDEEFVLSQMAAGVDGADAVQKFQGILKEHSAKAREATSHLPPVVLSGGAAPPPDANSVAKLPDKDIRNLIAQMVSNSQST